MVRLNYHGNNTERPRSSGGDGKFFKKRRGEMQIRVFGFDHIVSRGDWELGRYVSGDPEPGEVSTELYVAVRKHWHDGKPTICDRLITMDGRVLGDCVSCRTSQAFFEKGEKDLGKENAARTSYILNVVDMESDDLDMLIYEAPKTVIDEIVALLQSKAFSGKTVLGEAGMDLFFTFNPDAKSPGDYYSGFTFAAGEDLTDEGLEPVDLYLEERYVPEKYRKLVAPHIVEGNTKAQEAPEEEAPKTAPKKKRAKKKVTPKKKEPETLLGKKVSFEMDGETFEGEVTGQDLETQEWKVDCGEEEFFADTSDLTVIE